jgi:protein-disulfide isomerase
MLSRLALAALLAALSLQPAARAQQAVPPGSGDAFKDLSPIKEAEASLTGKRVAIYEFEDLECPACAHAFPIVHLAVDRYKIPLIRHDFPLQMHLWSRDAAITARYLQDKVSKEAAEQYRRDVFANQTAITSKDDLRAYTHKWFNEHKTAGPEPFVIDPDKLFAAEVQADYRLGERIGLLHTPTVFVIYPQGWVQVTDMSQLYTVIDNALAQAAQAPVPHAAVTHKSGH